MKRACLMLVLDEKIKDRMSMLEDNVVSKFSRVYGIPKHIFRGI